MKILHAVEFYHPSVGGAQEAVRRLSERLAGFGHDVTVATSRLPGRTDTLNGVRIAEFDVSGNLARGLRGEVDSYRNFVRGGKFDVVMTYAAQQWTTDALVPLLGEAFARKVLVPCGFSGLHAPAYREYFESMKDWIRKFDACVFLSETYQDIEFARRAGARRLTVIPNAASEDEFTRGRSAEARTRLGIRQDEFLILCVGSHTGAKGHREAIRMFQRSGLRKATLLIVGNRSPGGCARSCRLRAAMSRFSSRERRILVRELDRSETVAAFLAADLFLFPSNIECSPLVLFESMAAGTPFLASDVGNSAEIAAWSGGGELIATSRDPAGYSHADVDDGAKRIAALHADPKRRRLLAERGRAAWLERFTYEKAARRYETLYRELLAS
jgi:glycosyltransferase involved in cell wall biosynthesis